MIKDVELTPWVRFMVLFTDDASRNLPLTPGAPLPARVNAGDKSFVLRMEAPCFAQDQRLYSIHPLSLDLRVKMPTTFRFSPTIRRFDEPIFGMNSYEGLRPGHYLITMVVYNLDSRDPFTNPVSVAQKVVHHAGGNLAAQVDFQLNDLSFARLRNFIAMDIEILDPKTLRLANGQLVDALTAYTQNLPVVSGDIVPREKLALELPPHIFPFTPSTDNCQSLNTPSSFENPQLQDLANRIRDRRIDLLKVAKDYQERQKAEIPTPAMKRDWETTGWRAAAERWGLRPMEVKAGDVTSQLGYPDKMSVADLQTALECFYEIGEASDDLPAKCQFNDHGPLWQFCSAIGNYWLDTINAEKPYNGLVRALPFQYFTLCHSQHSARYIRVRKYIHPYKLKAYDNLPIAGGYSSEVNLRDAMSIGTDFGSDFMHEDAVNFAVKMINVKATGDATLLKRASTLKDLSQNLLAAAGLSATDDIVMGQMMQSFETVTSGMSQFIPPTDINAQAPVPGVEAGVKTKVTVSGEAGFSRQSFRWAFNYDIPYNFIGMNMNTTVTLESARLALEVERARTCYSVEADLTREIWEDGMLIDADYATGWRPRLYICFPAKDEPQRLMERFFAVYNNPDNGGMLDNQRAYARWFMTFRGERDYYVFLENLRQRFGLVYRDDGTPNGRIPEPIMNAIGELRKQNLLNRPNFPGAISSPRPPDDKFDTVANLEGWAPKFFRWVSESLNPWHSYGAPTITDQNNPDNRHFNRDGSSRQ
jgi:hypothetical protein